jgi:hypothetical protein
MSADVIPVSLNHLACHGRCRGHGHDVRQIEIRMDQPDAQRIAVKDRDSSQRRIVVELPGLLGTFDELVATDKLAGKQEMPFRLHSWIENALHAVGIIRRSEFARLAVEGGIRAVIDSRLDVESVRGAFVVDLWQ